MNLDPLQEAISLANQATDRLWEAYGALAREQRLAPAAPIAAPVAVPEDGTVAGYVDALSHCEGYDMLDTGDGRLSRTLAGLIQYAYGLEKRVLTNDMAAADLVTLTQPPTEISPAEPDALP
jgi:hypothetical protein